MSSVFCYQVPGALVVMHHLGLFFFWHVWNVIPVARVVCR